MFDSVKNFFARLPWLNIFFISLVILSVASGILCIIFTTKYWIIKGNIISHAREQAMQETQRAAKEIDNFMRSSLPPIVKSFTDDLTQGKIPKNELVARLEKKAKDINGIGVMFAPYAFDKEIKLYAPYYVERLGQSKLVQLEGIYDYTQQDRYKLPLQQGTIFLEPFFDPASETIVAEFGGPFYDQNGNKIGVVMANHSADHLQYIIQNMNLGMKGYGFIISRNGTYVAHPVKEYATAQKTIFQIAKELKSPQLDEVARKAIKGEAGYVDIVNEEIGELWIFFEPIPITGWSLVAVFFKDELDLNTASLKRDRIQIVLSFLLFLICLSLLFIRVDRGTNRTLWFGAMTVSFFFLCGTIYMWYVAYASIRYKLETEDAIIIQDRTSLTRFLETAIQVSQASQIVQLKQVEKQEQQAKESLKQGTPIAVPGKTVPQMHIDTDCQPNEIPKNGITVKLGTIQEPAQYSDLVHSKEAIQETIAAITKHLQEATQLLQKKFEPHEQVDCKKQEIKIASPKLPTKTVGFVGKTAEEIVSQPLSFMQTATSQQAQEPAFGRAPAQGQAKGAALTETQISIPTGLYLQHIQFKDINAVKFIGTFWQRYKKTIHDNVKRGIIFPMAEDVKQTEAYKFDEGDWEVIGWNVQGTVNQKFNYQAYPFDSKLMRIQMWPYDFDKGVILAPDLDAYKVIAPSSLPGIDPAVRLEQWYLGRSFFSYQRQKYLTNFGNYLAGPFGTIDQSKKSVTPELYFNVTMRRYIFNILILDLFPIIVVMTLLFLTLMLVGLGKFDKIYYALGTTASLFFTIILAHIRFKSSIPVQQIVFFEYLYLILYFLIIAVTAIAVFYILGSEARILRYRDLLIPELLYWPLVTGLMLVLSIINFY